jgi:hypothetical protein
VAACHRHRPGGHRRRHALLAGPRACGEGDLVLVGLAGCLGEPGACPLGGERRIRLRLRVDAALRGDAAVPDPSGARGHDRFPLAAVRRLSDPTPPSHDVAPLRAGGHRRRHLRPPRRPPPARCGGRSVPPETRAVGPGPGHPRSSGDRVRARRGSPRPRPGDVGHRRPSPSSPGRGIAPLRGGHRHQAMGAAGASPAGGHLSSREPAEGGGGGPRCPGRARPPAPGSRLG